MPGDPQVNTYTRMDNTLVSSVSLPEATITVDIGF